MKKKIINKSQFLKINLNSAKQMSKNRALKKKSYELIKLANYYRWIHQSTWMGEPILNIAQDIFAMQEIIYSYKPEYIIEIGVAWGGSLLFYSNLLNLNKGKKIIGIDIFVPKDLKKRIFKDKKQSKNIILMQADSTSEKTLEKVKNIVKKSKKVIVILDSNHTEDHVLKELNLYSGLVKKGGYLICCDTLIDYVPQPDNRPRPWGPKNNPATALKKFFKVNKRFAVDKKIENKLLLSSNFGGYLKALK